MLLCFPQSSTLLILIIELCHHGFPTPASTVCFFLTLCSGGLQKWSRHQFSLYLSLSVCKLVLFIHVVFTLFVILFSALRITDFSLDFFIRLQLYIGNTQICSKFAFIINSLHIFFLFFLIGSMPWSGLQLIRCSHYDKLFWWSYFIHYI